MMEAEKTSALNELISLFEYNISQYKGKTYDEAKTRADFIDKFFSLKEAEKAFHDRMVEMVEHMLELQKKYHSVKIQTEKNLFKKQIHILDHQIDQLVYQLYQLTEDEIKIIENDAGENK